MGVYWPSSSVQGGGGDVVSQASLYRGGHSIETFVCKLWVRWHPIKELAMGIHLLCHATALQWQTVLKGFLQWTIVDRALYWLILPVLKSISDLFHHVMSIHRNTKGNCAGYLLVLVCRRVVWSFLTCTRCVTPKN